MLRRCAICTRDKYCPRYDAELALLGGYVCADCAPHVVRAEILLSTVKGYRRPVSRTTNSQ
jgi:hypothetical protein